MTFVPADLRVRIRTDSAEHACDKVIAIDDFVTEAVLGIEYPSPQNRKRSLQIPDRIQHRRRRHRRRSPQRQLNDVDRVALRRARNELRHRPW